MKYPVIIKEQYPARSLISLALVKSFGMAVSEDPPPQIPPGETELRPLPNPSLKPPGVLCQSPVNMFELPNDVHGPGANYKVLIDGFEVNANHENDLYESSHYQGPEFTDGVLDVKYIDWNCGTNAGIQLTERGVEERIPVYPHQTKTCLITFIPKPDQSPNYVWNGIEPLTTQNPGLNINLLEGGAFTVCMRTQHSANPTTYRYDDMYSDSHWSSTEENRTNKAKLAVVDNTLDYSVNVNGEIQNVGNLIGKTLTFGLFILTFTSMSNYVQIEMTYDGEITEEINNSYYYVRLTPNGSTDTWAQRYRQTYGELDVYLREYEDGVIEMNMDVQELKAVPPVIEPEPVYNYTVVTDFKSAPVMSQLNTIIADTRARANAAWVAWVESRNITTPENTHKPRAITTIRVRDHFPNNDIVLANHTMEVKQYKDSNGAWTTIPVHTLIGDGNKIYLMKTEDELKLEGRYPHDFVSKDITLEEWMITTGYRFINRAILQTFHNIPPSTPVSGILSEYSFTSDWDQLRYGDVVTTKFINTGIMVRCETSVKPGSVTTPTVGIVYGNPVPYGTLTRGSQVL